MKFIDNITCTVKSDMETTIIYYVTRYNVGNRCPYHRQAQTNPCLVPWHSFADSANKINVVEIFKSISPDTTVKVI